MDFCVRCQRHDGERQVAGFKPSHAKQVVIGTLLISTASTVATWDTYDNGFWDQGGLLTIKSLTPMTITPS